MSLSVMPSTTQERPASRPGVRKGSHSPGISPHNPPLPARSPPPSLGIPLHSRVNLPLGGSGLLRYVGPIAGKDPEVLFAGVELVGAAIARGKNSGDAGGEQYFNVTHAGSGIFLPYARLVPAKKTTLTAGRGLANHRSSQSSMVAPVSTSTPQRVVSLGPERGAVAQARPNSEDGDRMVRHLSIARKPSTSSFLTSVASGGSRSLVITRKTSTGSPFNTPGIKAHSFNTTTSQSPKLSVSPSANHAARSSPASRESFTRRDSGGRVSPKMRTAHDQTNLGTKDSPHSHRYSTESFATTHLMDDAFQNTDLRAVAALEAARDKLEGENALLAQRLEERSEILNELRELVAEYEPTIEKMEQDLADQAKRHMEVIHERDLKLERVKGESARVAQELREALAGLEDDMSKNNMLYLGEVERLKSELERGRLEVVRVQREHRELEARLRQQQEAGQADLAAVRAGKAALDSATRETAAEERGSEAEQLRVCEQELAAEKVKLKQLEFELEAVRLSLERLQEERRQDEQQAGAARQALEATVARLTQEGETQAELVRELQGRISHRDAKTDSKDPAALEREVQKLRLILENTASGLLNRDQHIDAMKKQLNTQAREAEREKAAAASRVEALQAQLKEVTTGVLPAEAEKLRQEIKVLQLALLKAGKMLAVKNNDIEILRGALDAGSVRDSTGSDMLLDSQTKTLRKMLDKARGNLATKDMMITDLNNEVAYLNKHMTSKSTLDVTLDPEIAHLRKLMLVLREENAMLKSNANYPAPGDTLLSPLERALAVNDSQLHVRVEELNVTISRLESQLQLALQENHHLNDRLGTITASPSSSTYFQEEPEAPLLQVYQPPLKDVTAGRKQWCGLCERQGHDSVECPYENDMF